MSVVAWAARALSSGGGCSQCFHFLLLAEVVLDLRYDLLLGRLGAGAWRVATEVAQLA